MSDDGRILVGVGLAALAVVAATRGSRGVVRSGVRIKEPEGPVAWQHPMRRNNPLWTGPNCGKPEQVDVEAWFTRLPQNPLSIAKHRLVAFSWPVMLGGDPVTDKTSFGRLGIIYHPPDDSRKELDGWFGKSSEARAAAAYWWAVGDREPMTFEPNHQPGDGSRYSFATVPSVQDRDDDSVGLLWSFLPWRRQDLPRNGYLEQRAVIVDLADAWEPMDFGDRLGLNASDSEDAAGVFWDNVGRTS